MIQMVRPIKQGFDITDAESWQPGGPEFWRLDGFAEHKFQARAVQDIQIEGLFNSRGPHFCIVEVEAYCK